MNCFQHYILNINLGEFNIHFSLVKEERQSSEDKYFYQLHKEFEHVSPIFWKGVADKKYFAISLALDMFHDILEEIIESENITIHTVDSTPGIEEHLLNDSDLTSNWEYSDSDSDSEGQSNQADITNYNCTIEADEWTSLYCSEGPSDEEDNKGQ